MSFNTVGQYSANHKVWDHVGNIIPDVENSEGFRPYLEGKPAAWLPVQFYDKHYEDWIVTMPGKIVGTDPQGRIVPQQYMLTGSTVTYTTNDVAAGVIDVRTGTACTAASVSASPITLGSVTAWMGVTGLTWVVKPPIGVAPYAYLKWAGDGSANDDGNNPAYYVQHNYNRQSRVAVLCDYVLELPIVPASQTATALTGNTHSGHLQTFTALGNLPVAANTTRTPFAFTNGTLTDASTRFVNQVNTVTEIVSLGDWHVNLQTGVITAFASATLAGGNIYNIAYYHYTSAAGVVSAFASVLAPVTPGDMLKCDTNSNWVVATPKIYGVAVGGHNWDDHSYIMGQILEIQSQPQDMLDRVRTAWSSLGTSATGALPGTAGQLDQMPGSATGGVTDKVHYAGAANLVALVNLISR